MDRVIIIAEAGVNHNGNIKTAFKLVEEAKNAGADYIKFQTFVPNKLVTRYSEKAAYQKNNTASNESQLEMLEKLALSWDDFLALHSYCNELGIGFLSTAFDDDSIAFLNRLNMDYWKIPSGEITNLPYLEKIASLKGKVLLSTGMSEISDILSAIRILEDSGASDITVLHCNTQYPTPMNDVNLLAMSHIKEVTGREIGYSDHTLGIEVPIAAVSLGAKVIEKHFTLSKDMDGPDHKASLTPSELSAMIKAIRNIEAALGRNKKEITESERDNIAIARKSIVAKRNIHTGEEFTTENLTVKRPGTGISPMRWYDILGKTANRDFYEDELIEL